MSNGGISASGRVLRWVMWRAPKRAVAYTVASNMNLVSDMGRRWIVWGVLGAYLWGMRWLAVHVVPPLRVVSAVLLLLWFWHGINLVKWTMHARATAARARAMQRQQFQMIEQLPGQIQQAVGAAASRAQGGIDMFGAIRRQPQGPATKEEAFQAGLPWAGEPPPGMEPLIPWRRLFRRRQ
jgi:hypothetical protein